ncbi:MAG: DinB family protein [Desulfobacterales bacterium]
MAYDLQQSFRSLARYNERANIEMYSVLAGLTGRARKRDMGSWFGSLHGILNHVLAADLHWLQRYRALAPDSAVLADQSLNPPNLSWGILHEDFDSLRRERGVVDVGIRDWFEEFPSDRYGDRFTYLDSAGTRRPATAASAFEFLFLHQIHHRGQVSQILDQLGLPNNFADNAAFLEHGE